MPSQRRFRKRRGRRMPFSKKQAKAIKKLAQADDEVKKHEQSFDDTDLYAGNGASSNPLSSIIQGDGDGQRIGDKLKLQRYVWRGVLNAKSSQAGILRLYVIQYSEDSLGTGLTDIAPDEFFPDRETTGTAYKVLANKILKVCPNGNNEKQLFKISIPGKRLQNVKYDTGATTMSNGNVMCFVSTDDDVSTGNISMLSNIKIFYTDS